MYRQKNRPLRPDYENPRVNTALRYINLAHLAGGPSKYFDALDWAARLKPNRAFCIIPEGESLERIRDALYRFRRQFHLKFETRLTQNRLYVYRKKT